MWEMATDDYEFRYQNIFQKNLGECSNVKDKQEIFRHLIRQIRIKDSNYSIPEISRETIVNTTKNVMRTVFEGTILKTCSEREFKSYLDISKSFTKSSFGVGEQLFCGNVSGVNAIEFYDRFLYRQRNRLAHNTTSYLENIPGFSSLADPNDILRNYFLFYAYLMMMDGVFVEAFNKYLSLY